MEDIKSIGVVVIGFLLTLITTVGGWVFKNVHTRLDKLESHQARLEQRIEMVVLELKSEIKINSERDKAFQDKVMTALESITKWQEEIKEHIKKLYENDKEDGKI